MSGGKSYRKYILNIEKDGHSRLKIEMALHNFILIHDDNMDIINLTL